MNYLRKLGAADIHIAPFIIAFGLSGLILAAVGVGIREAKKAQTEVVAPTTSTLTDDEKASGEGEKIEDETGITKDLGWKPVVPGSFRFDRLVQMYEIKFAGGTTANGRMVKIRSAWLRPDPLGKIPNGDIMAKKNLQAHIIWRPDAENMAQTSYIAVAIK